MNVRDRLREVGVVVPLSRGWRYDWDEPPAHPIEAMMNIQAMRLTAAALCDIRVQRLTSRHSR